jgi:hypothetical protein
MSRSHLPAFPDHARDLDDSVDGWVPTGGFRVDGDERYVEHCHGSVDFVGKAARNDAKQVGNARVVATRRKTAAALFAGSHGFFAGADDAPGGVALGFGGTPSLAEGAVLELGAPSGTFLAAIFCPVRCSISYSIQSFRSSKRLKCSSSKWRPLM